MAIDKKRLAELNKKDKRVKCPTCGRKVLVDKGYYGGLGQR